MSEAVKIVVSGKVQGVCFRAATQKQALKLGVKGWVKNLASGEVEINAVAEKQLLNQFIAWCHKGSLFAKVESVVVTELAETASCRSFEIVRD
jgi:acylphosphatase